MTRILITRPKADSVALAEEFKQYDIDSIIDPMLRIETIEDVSEKVGEYIALKPQAIIITSKHALEPFRDSIDFASIPLLASGMRTAEFAQSLGFRNVSVTGETVDQLIEHVKDELSPKDGPLLYLSGEDVTTDLDEALEAYDVGRLVTYRAHVAKRFSPETIRQLNQGDVDGVVFFSTRTAKAYLSCLKETEISNHAKNITAYCLSQAVAKELPEDQFKTIIAASHPTVKSMIDTISKESGLVTVKPPIETQREEPMVEKIEKTRSHATGAPSHTASYAPQEKRSPFLGLCVLVLFLMQIASGAYIAYINHLLPIKPPASIAAPAVSEAMMVQAFDRGDIQKQLVATDTRLDQLEEAFERTLTVVESINTETDALETATSKISEAEEANDSLQAELQEAIQRIETLEKAKISDTRIKEILAMKQQIESLHNSVNANEQNHMEKIHLLTSFDSVKQSVLSGQPYTEAMAAFNLVVKENKALSALAQPLNDKQHDGIATQEQLAKSFDSAIKNYWTASFAKEEGEWSDVKKNLSKLISIRKVGETHSGSDAGSIIARAEAKLKNKQLQEAITLIESLPEENKPAFSAWLQNATAHIQAKQKLEELKLALVAQVKAEEE